MNLRDYLLLIITAVAIGGIFLLEPIPQDQEYHHFVDQRNFLGMPNFLDVITNFSFIIVGIAGIYFSKKMNKLQLKVISLTLFVGFILLTFGSGYYHLYPNDYTLVFDRIPMSIIFMSFFAIFIYDYINPKIGFYLFLILLGLGIFSVMYWYYTETLGKGDLRIYGLVQFFPVLAIPLIIWLYRSHYNYVKDIVPIYFFFGLAKLTEALDEEIFELLQVISGHSLKHLFMAISGAFIIVMIKRRKNQI
jgi:hypothetical protein